MPQFSRSEITQRLGQDPSQWTFLGQCYEASPNNPRVCAVTLKPTLACFTLKLRSGAKGRMTISPEAIEEFERWNPDLYIELKAGLLFLELRRRAFASDIEAAAVRRRIVEAQKKNDVVRREAKSRLQSFRRTYRKEQLPEYLETMRLLLQRTGHYFQQEGTRALALEQANVEIERALIAARAAEGPAPAQPEPEPSTPVPALVTSLPGDLELTDIPELPF